MAPLRGQRGFSALELTLVIAIIAVLVMGLMWPRYMRGAQSASRAACLSNLKQIGTAMMMYAYDHAGRLPVDPEPWDALNEYTANQQIFRCPAAEPAPQPPQPPANALAPGPPPAPVSSDYTYLPGLANDDPPESPLLADDTPRHDGKANVVMLSGQALTVSEADRRRMGFAQDAPGGESP